MENKKKQKKRNNNSNQKYQLYQPQTREQILANLSSARFLNLGQRSYPYPVRQHSSSGLTAAVELFSGVNAWSIVEFKINDVRDPFGTGLAAEGYSVYSTYFRKFRVSAVSISYEVTNTETITPINVYMTFNDTQPSTYITSWDTANLCASSTYSTRPLLSPGNTANSQRKQPVVNIPMGDVLGNSLEYAAGVAYSGTDTSSPTQVLWCAFVAYSGDAATFFADGLVLSGRIVFKTDFYSLRPLLI